MPEEPYELIAHVLVCGGVALVTGRFYPEADATAPQPKSFAQQGGEHLIHREFLTDGLCSVIPVLLQSAA